VALGTTVLLDLALIPALEVNGTAIASSLAYVLSLMMTLSFYRRLATAKVWAALLPRASDRHFYLGLWRRLWSATLPAGKRPV
jgi:Na+-driven multidrug efflux pump